MKYFLILVILFSSMLVASSSDEKKSRAEKQLQIEIEKEKKYAREQVFYTQDNYDLKGAEVNPHSINSVPSIEVQDDFDMDSVYD